MDRTMIPIPPSHWLVARQKMTPWPMSSGAAMTEAPVVVKPDIDSKKASTGPSEGVQSM